MREYKVNFISLDKHNSIEHGGPLDGERICAWADLLLALVRRAMALQDDEALELDPDETPFVPHIVPPQLWDNVADRLAAD